MEERHQLHHCNDVDNRYKVLKLGNESGNGMEKKGRLKVAVIVPNALK